MASDAPSPSSSDHGSEETLRLGNYVVCILDVLAQQENLQAWSKLPADGRMSPDFIAGLKATVGAVSGFHGGFTQFFEAQRSGASQLGKLNLAMMSGSDRALYVRQKEFELGVVQFSDTFVFYAPLSNAQGELLVLPVYAILAACCMAMLWSLAAKLPLRGGISLGPGIKLPELSFYGPALAEAHQIESAVSQYPRIVVSPSVVGFVQHTPTGTGCRWLDDWIRDMLTLSRGMLCHDTFDGQVIVDWLGSDWRRVIGYPNLDDVTWRALRQAHDFVDASLCGFQKDVQSSPDTVKAERARKLATRYEALYRYMLARLPGWGVTFVDGDLGAQEGGVGA